MDADEKIDEEFLDFIICYAHVESKSKKVIYSVLNEFIPNYNKLDPEYAVKPNDEDYIFKSEDEMVSYFIDTPNLSQTFFWCKLENNPDEVTVGAEITDDNQLIISLTLDGRLELESKYYLRLQKFLNSKVGVIYYNRLAEHDNGEDFIRKYKDVKYEFE